MKKMNFEHYAASPPIPICDRVWPTRRLEKAPRWCSVDLRDGNQALSVSMNFHEKARLFNLLCDLGFKDIEISFPSANETEFSFTRFLIQNDVIPEDVRIQVMCNAKPELIARSFEALDGVRRAVFHFYVSLSPVHRESVLKMNREDCLRQACEAARLILELARRHECRYPGSHFDFQYSAESFSLTEPDFAVQVCDAVTEIWAEDQEREIIMNLCNTVEACSPNYYADQIEYFCRNSRYRERMTVSVHSHNDRGSAVAATEMALLAGGERVEGTLFGTGERAGNADLVTLALNFMTQGIDPQLDFSDLKHCVRVVEECMKMKIPSRQPYAGEDIYATFSGTHQDAIRKFLSQRRRAEKGSLRPEDEVWHVPYLPIDPWDLGMYDAQIIRINAQSGRSGVAYIMEEMYGLRLPTPLLGIFAEELKRLSDREQRELSYREIYSFFRERYMNLTSPLRLLTFSEHTLGKDRMFLEAKMLRDDRLIELRGEGRGVLHAINHAVGEELGLQLELEFYSQEALEGRSESTAVSYLALRDKKRREGRLYYGVGSSSNLTKASLRAYCSAVNAYYRFYGDEHSFR